MRQKGVDCEKFFNYQLFWYTKYTISCGFLQQGIILRTVYFGTLVCVEKMTVNQILIELGSLSVVEILAEFGKSYLQLFLWYHFQISATVHDLSEKCSIRIEYASYSSRQKTYLYQLRKNVFFEKKMPKVREGK